MKRSKQPGRAKRKIRPTEVRVGCTHDVVWLTGLRLRGSFTLGAGLEDAVAPHVRVRFPLSPLAGTVLVMFGAGEACAGEMQEYTRGVLHRESRPPLLGTVLALC
jgi:hypothetical protein